MYIFVVVFLPRCDTFVYSNVVKHVNARFQQPLMAYFLVLFTKFFDNPFGNELVKILSITAFQNHKINEKWPKKMKEDGKMKV